MAYSSRLQNPSVRHSSVGSLQQSSGQSPLLVARISEKRAELENLKQLKDLSAGLAAQMQSLEEKLSMLSDGTEGPFHCSSLPPCVWWLLLTVEIGREHSRGYCAFELA